MNAADFRRILFVFLLSFVCAADAASPGAARPVAAEWAAVQREIQQDRAGALARYRAAFANTGADADPADRLVRELKVLRAEVQGDEDNGRSVARMLVVGDELALLGQGEWAIAAWREASRQYFLRGDYANAQASAQRVLDAARRYESRKDEAQALNDLGVLAKRRGDIRSATLHYENALVIRRNIGDRIGIAQSLGNLAIIEKNRGALLKALAYQREAQQHVLAVDRPNLLANAHDALGLIYLALDDAIEAERQFREAIRIGDLPAYRDQIVNSRINLCVALLRQGRIDDAAPIAAAARQHAEARGLKPMITSVGLVQAEIARRRDALDDAERLLDETMALARELGDSKEIIEPLLERAELHMVRQRVPEARADVDEALSLARRDQLRLLERAGLEIRSRVLLAAGDADAAFQARLDYERTSREIAGATLMRRMAELLDEERRREAAETTARTEAPARHGGRLPPLWIALGVLGLVGIWLGVRIGLARPEGQ